jgi:hypothetical protein
MPNPDQKTIGGVFAPEPLPEKSNTLIAHLKRPDDDLRHMMSGRCGIMLGIEDWMKQDSRRVAYLPAYTCETVSGCFVKSGYIVRYYDFDRNLKPLYDPALLAEISLFLACGYYGFVTMEEAFARQCRERGVGVIFDATHSLFTTGGIPASAHYMTASLRKWFPVACGGVAVKYGGRFGAEPHPLHERHLELRYAYLDSARCVREGNAPPDTATDAFWDAELLLRDIYGAQQSDSPSVEAVTRYPVERLIEKRVENYAALLAAFPDCDWVKPVFPALPEGTCPSHFPVYCGDRDALQQTLRGYDIHATVYWPVPPFIEIGGYPGARWIYQHILALPCDQRYGLDDMKRIAAAVAEIAASPVALGRGGK